MIDMDNANYFITEPLKEQLEELNECIQILHNTQDNLRYTEVEEFANGAATFAAAKPGSMIAVPFDLIASACSAIDKKRDAPKTLAELRRYTTGDLSCAALAAAPQAPAPVELPEPFALYDEEKWYANEEAAICSCANMQKLQKIYTEQQVRELLAAAPKLPQGDGWLPIESAPRDGTLIVVHGNNFNDSALGQHCCIAAWCRGCWMESSEWSAPSELEYLTHWMPLPQPPKEQE